MIKITKYITPQYNSNTYILCSEDDKIIIIDPTIYSFHFIKDLILENKLILEYILPTHGHFDHIEGISSYRKEYKFKVIANKECSESMTASKRNYSYYYSKLVNNELPADIEIEEDNYKILWENNEIDIFKTPGHSPCSACISINNVILFTGDTLLKDYKAVTKLPDSNKEQHNNSLSFIFNKFSTETIIYPGHGEEFLLSTYK